MTPARHPTLVLVLALSTACAPTSAPPDDAREGAPGTAVEEAVTSEVRAVSTRLVEAMNAHQPDSILAFYDLGPGFTYVGCTNFTLAGETFANILRGYHLANADVRYDMAVQTVRVLGRDAAVVSLRGMSSPDLALFTTRVVHRSPEGLWKVVWEHESWPGCAAPTAMHPGTVGGDLAAEAPTLVP